MAGHKILKGKCMLIERKVERYVEGVISYIPSAQRGRAARDVTDMINDMISDYAAGREPDILDAREVLRTLGSPEEIAVTWMAADEERKLEEEAEKKGRISAAMRKLPPVLTQRYVSRMMTFFTVLSVLFVIVGLLGLGTHVISTMLPIFVGLILALVSMTGRSVLIKLYS